MILEINKVFTEHLSKEEIKIDGIFEADSNFAFNIITQGITNQDKLDFFFAISEDDVEYTQFIVLTSSNFHVYYKKYKKYHIKFLVIANKLTKKPIFLENIELPIKSVRQESLDSQKLPEIVEPLLIVQENELAEMTDLLGELQMNASQAFFHMNGIAIKYFRVLPDSEGIDVILKEYSGKNYVESLCDLKIYLPDGVVPDNDPEYNEWGIDFNSFEIEIEPYEFEKTFGIGSKPRQDDFIFFDGYNLIFRVGSSYAKSGLNGKNLSYVCTLAKYDHDVQTEQNCDSEEFLKDKLLFQEDVFEKELKEEYSDVLETESNSIATENVREIMNDDLMILNDPIYNNGTLLMKQYYDSRNILPNTITVQYQKTLSVMNKGSFGFHGIYRFFNKETHNIFDSTDLKLEYQQTFNKFKLTIKGEEKLFENVPDLSINWNVICLQYSIIHGYCGVYVYQLDLLPTEKYKTTLLMKYQKEEILDLPEIINNKISILASSKQFGNIRLTNQSVDINNQNYLMQSADVKDMSKIIIRDDANPILNQRNFSNVQKFVK